VAAACIFAAGLPLKQATLGLIQLVVLLALQRWCNCLTDVCTEALNKERQLGVQWQPVGMLRWRPSQEPWKLSPIIMEHTLAYIVIMC
jgi:hypothetical protein